MANLRGPGCQTKEWRVPKVAWMEGGVSGQIMRRDGWGQ